MNKLAREFPVLQTYDSLIYAKTTKIQYIAKADVMEVLQVTTESFQDWAIELPADAMDEGVNDIKTWIFSASSCGT